MKWGTHSVVQRHVGWNRSADVRFRCCAANFGEVEVEGRRRGRLRGSGKLAQKEKDDVGGGEVRPVHTKKGEREG